MSHDLNNSLFKENRLLQVINLKKYFGGVKAVDGVSFHIDKGEKVAIIGPNGAGKSTLINLISGYILPTDGKIIYQGKSVEKTSMIKRVQMGIVRSWQIPQLFESLTVKEALITSILSRTKKIYNMWKDTSKYIQKQVIQEVSELCSSFNLRETKPVKELSEGERKLLDVALSFSLQPKLLLLDEPTSGVSSYEKFYIIDMILRVALEKKTTVIVVEHDIEVVQKYFPRIIFKNEGKILYDGSFDTLMGEESLKYLLGG